MFLRDLLSSPTTWVAAAITLIWFIVVCFALVTLVSVRVRKA
jgi:hypothetical protein